MSEPTPDLPTATEPAKSISLRLGYETDQQTGDVRIVKLPPDLPERMSEERLTELRGFACITYVAELFDHIDALTAENADLRRSLDVAETAFRVAEKIATASNNERDAARAECERLREELATTQRLYITAQDDIGYLDQRIANLKKELEHAVAQGYRTGHGTDSRCVGRNASHARGPGMDGPDADCVSGPGAGSEVRSGETPHQDHAADDLPASAGLPMIDDAVRRAAMNAAIWVTASPHEWEWTKSDQVAMARFCIAGLREGGVGLIAAERERQQSVEGWTPGHDDAHSRMEMVDAAVCYLRFGNIGMQGYPPHAWPWEASWWKPADPIRNLVKAGALIAAEIDRLQRAAARAALERTQ